MKRPGRVAATVALAFSLGGCVTGSGGSAGGEGGGQVVERSKAQAPAWTALAAGRMHETEATYSYVELRTRLRDLPLGLKTTQLGAVDASRNALAAMARGKLEGDLGRLSAVAASEFDRKLGEATADIHTRYVKVVDIYFEKLTTDRDDLPDYYNAFVLVTMPRDRLSELYEALARKLIASSDSGLRGLGQSLQARVKSGGMSH